MSHKTALFWLALGPMALLAACQEYKLREPPRVPPATPPGDPGRDEGNPPNWQDCFGGYRGTYSNLGEQNPDILSLNSPDDTGIVPTYYDQPEDVTWWNRVVFDRYDPTLDFGGAFYPVDEGLEGDPDYFGVVWLGWLRAWSDTDLQFLVATTSDTWVVLDDEVIYQQQGLKEYESETFTHRVDGGQYPLRIYFAHRGGQSGFRFRITGGDVKACYPDYEDDTQ